MPLHAASAAEHIYGHRHGNGSPPLEASVFLVEVLAIPLSIEESVAGPCTLTFTVDNRCVLDSNDTGAQSAWQVFFFFFLYTGPCINK